MRTTGLLLTVTCFLVSIAPAMPQADPVGLRLLVSGTEEEALELRNRIEAGQSFESLARSRSLDPSAASGGYLGQFAIADLREEFRNAVGGLGPGALSPVFQFGADYAVLQILGVAEEAWMRERDAGMEDVRQRRYVEATGRFQSALEHAGQFGSEDLRLATSLNDLAEVYRIQGDTALAVPLYRQALAIWEGAPGTDRLDIATALNNLAEAYRSEGNQVEAEPLYRRALAIWEEDLGGDHTNVATGLNNLALALHAEQRLEEAESLFRRALSIWEVSLGPTNPSVAAVLTNLANVLRSGGAYADAEPLARRSLAIMEQLVGPTHPELVPNLDNLGELAWIQEDYAEAALQYSRSLETRWGTTASPGEFTSVIEDLADLVALGLVRDEGFDDTFNGFVENAHRISSDPDLHAAIGGIFLSAGLADQGEVILVRANERFPGSWPLHFRLGEFYADTGRFGLAMEEFASALESAAPTPIRYRILVRMGDIHRELDDLDASLAQYRDAADLATDGAAANFGLGLVYTRQDRLSEAVAAFERAALMDPAGVEAHFSLADLYMRLERFDEAAAAAETAVSGDPTHRRAHYLLGRALGQIGRGDDAQLALSEYARLESEERARENRVLESVRVQTDAIQALTDGDANAALETLRGGIDAYPEAVRLHLALGLIHIRQGQHRDGIETLGGIVDAGLGDDSVVHRSLAGAYARLGETVPGGRHTALFLQRIRRELEAQLPR